jgi:hypothetical protein
MKQSKIPNPRGYWIAVAERMKVNAVFECESDKDARNLTRALRRVGFRSVRKTDVNGTIKVWRVK